MSVPISDSLFLDYLQCEYKAYLKLSGESGVSSDFEKFQNKINAEYRQQAWEHLLTTGRTTAPPEVNSTFKDVKMQKLSVAINISISNDKYSMILDAAELASQSLPRKPFYNPIIFLPHQKISKKHKLLLAFSGSALSYEQKAEPISGRIIFGDKFSSTKVQLASLIKVTGKIEKEIAKIVDTQTAPPLRLNNHCKICEFQEVCYAAAKEKDDLSLMKGLSGKEINTLNKRGIFTVTQYSYTFRPRRVNKSATQKIIKHHHSLNALAIRTKTIYISGRPDFPTAAVHIYLDVEGTANEGCYYLIGLIVDDGESLECHQFWADSKPEEKIIWEKLLSFIGTIPDFMLFHYGGYERTFIKRMEASYGGDIKTINKLKSRTINVLAAIYGNIYFPTYSNDLKSIATFLGYKWATEDATGLKSLLWRYEWDITGSTILKQRLLEYNSNDCMGLRIITENIMRLSKGSICMPESFSAKNVDEIKAEKPLGLFKRNDFCFPELEKINRCAYFDYQRDKVYFRIGPIHRKTIRKKVHECKKSYKINLIMKLRRPNKCPQCDAACPYRHANYSKVVYDIKMSESGIKRWVVKYIYSRFHCRECNKAFVPTIYKTFTASKYGQNLMAWVIYQHIGRLKSQQSIVQDLEEIFKYHFPNSIIGDFKTRAANCYKSFYDKLWSNLLSGTLLHADETKVSVRGVTNYVWAFANIDTVFYIHTTTREGDFLKEKLSGFNGVLVSDFYTAYDSISCVQQKCLIHLIRDINDDILKNPFDYEMKELGKDFTALLTPIIGTIDKYGLKKRHLHKHSKEVQEFFKKLEIRGYDSELAQKLPEKVR